MKKNKVRKKFGPLDRCKNVPGIHFSHPQSDSTKLSIRYRLEKKTSGNFKGYLKDMLIT